VALADIQRVLPLANPKESFRAALRAAEARVESLRRSS
jgi:hypothetical protein